MNGIILCLKNAVKLRIYFSIVLRIPLRMAFINCDDVEKVDKRLARVEELGRASPRMSVANQLLGLNFLDQFIRHLL